MIHDRCRYRMPLVRLTFMGLISLSVSACAGGQSQDSLEQERVTQDPAAMMRIANAADQSGDVTGAIAFFRRAAALQPDSASAQTGIAKTLAEQGHVGEAVDTLRSAHAHMPSDELISTTLGRLLVATHCTTEALDVFHDGLQHNPQSIPLLIGQAVALDQIGKHADAQNSYRQVMAIDPNNAAAHRDLKLSLSQSGRGSAAGGPSGKQRTAQTQSSGTCGARG
jgi:Flp pilus assembly protein TadD